MSHLSRRLDAIKRRLDPDELILVSVCPKCAQTILGRGIPAPEREHHELAPPPRPGDKPSYSAAADRRSHNAHPCGLNRRRYPALPHKVRRSAARPGLRFFFGCGETATATNNARRCGAVAGAGRTADVGRRG